MRKSLDEIKVLYEHWLFRAPVLRRFSGITLFPYILFKERREKVPVWLRRHELQHVYQIWSVGSVWKWYVWYLVTLLETGYENHPAERDARAHQGLPMTHEEWRVFDND